MQYMLIGVMEHSSRARTGQERAKKGHYVAYARRLDGQWRCFDDIFGDDVSQQTVLGVQAYELMYVRCGSRLVTEEFVAGKRRDDEKELARREATVGLTTAQTPTVDAQITERGMLQPTACLPTPRGARGPSDLDSGCGGDNSASATGGNSSGSAGGNSSGIAPGPLRETDRTPPPQLPPLSPTPALGNYPRFPQGVGGGRQGAH